LNPAVKCPATKTATRTGGAARYRVRGA